MSEDRGLDTTRPPQRMLRDAEPSELFAAIPQLGDLVKLRPRHDENGLHFLARLRASTTPEEAVTFTSFAASPSAAAGWGYECLRLMADHLQAHERPMMESIATWLAAPSTRLRHEIMREALWAPSRSPSILLALAVGWSTGGPAPNDPERAPPHKTPVALNSAVLSCLARADLSRRSFYLARFLDMAEALFRAY
ncbi:hypothetical protein SAMN04487972_10942 [Paracoccus halophilus]|uniref:Uncharacterized protein n=1 Tax=Paracoccus halophilus TaxID=376733 RepID=A0A099F238_9RHOB|nr:hypothetical protein [Paracoccus halophilus]KGJ04237.1 hypothetical protein IT41_11140 [Paracoccus halophilus]SFA52036.1 hypothetical protein SAMN04487972_10942 [Paracoccus halophilus]